MKLPGSKLLLGTLLAVALLLVGIALWLWQPGADWSLEGEAIDAIKPGMSRTEVEQILGGPPGFRGEPVDLYHGMARCTHSKSVWTPIPEDAEDGAMALGTLEDLPARLDGLWIGTFALFEEDAAGAFHLSARHRAVIAIRIKFDAAGKVIDKRCYQGMGTRKLSRLETWREWIQEKLNWDGP